MKSLFRFTIYIISLGSFSTNVAAQEHLNPLKPWLWKTHRKWYFGQKNILEINPDGITPPNISVFNNSNARSFEGVSSACDEQGNLILATNGVTLWDGNGNEISLPDGKLFSGAELPNGQQSSSNLGVMIVKHPKNSSEYYIFTADDEIMGRDHDSTYGFNYVIYNSINNTASKKTRLGNYRTTEIIAATWHKNMEDIWIVTHSSHPLPGSKKYYSYLLKSNSIENVPVESELGFPIIKNTNNERGGFAFNSQGSKALATHHLGNGTWDLKNALEILDFDNNSGKFTNAIGFGPSKIEYSNSWYAQWSPDGTNVFVSFTASPYTPGTLGRVEYWDINDLTTPNLVGKFSSAISAGQINIGADENMYVASFKDGGGWSYTSSLAKISDPNGKPLWDSANVVLPANSVSYGLPNSFVPPSNLTVSTLTFDEISATLFPNPTRENTTLTIGGVSSEIISIQILNSLGTILLEQKIDSNKKEIELYTSHLTAGVYFIRLSTNKEKGIKKTLKLLKF